MKRILIAGAFFGLLLLLWQILVMSRNFSPVLLPSPATIAERNVNSAAPKQIS